MTKVLGWILLLAGGFLSLPITSYFLDGQGTENLILPVAIFVAAAFGALVGVGVPGFIVSTRSRQVALGAAYGVGAAVVTVVVFFFTLSGFRGA